MDDGQVAIESNASQEEASTEEVQVSQHTIEHAEEVSEYPAGDAIDQLKGQREDQHEVSKGEVQQVDFCDAQPVATPQQDGDHEAISWQTQEEDEAVEHRGEHGVKGLEALFFLITDFWNVTIAVIVIVRLL